jgi:two-component system, response regulator, stage 0 sporulation protein F
MQQPNPSALIIDDDEDVCFLLVKALAVQKINAATAHTLQQAVHCLQEVKPDLILLDNNLPDGSGIEFLHHIRSFNPEARVIMITADTKIGIREQALKGGVDRFLPKPFDLTTILEEVRNLLSPR